MKLIWHIAKRDIYRSRWSTVFWLSLIVLRLALDRLCFSESSVDPEWFDRVQHTVSWINVLDVLVGFLLMGSILQSDPVASSSAFWMTRPISAYRLLGGKMIAATLLCVVSPMLVHVVDMGIQGFGGAAIGEVVSRILGWQSLLLSIAIVVACFSGQTTWFVGIAVLLAAVFGAFVSVAATDQRASESVMTLRISSWLVYLTGMALTGVAVIWSQYSTRNLIRSALLFGVGIFISVACVFIWPWDFVGSWRKAHPLAIGPHGVTVELRDALILNWRNRSKSESRTMAVNFVVKGLPPEGRVRSGRATLEFRWKDGTAWRQEFHLGELGYVRERAAKQLLALPFDKDEEERMARRNLEYRLRDSALGRLIYPHFADGAGLSGQFPVPEQIVQKLAQETPVCSGKIEYDYWLGRQECRLPLTVGNEMAGDSSVIRIIRMGNRWHPTDIKNQSNYPRVLGAISTVAASSDLEYLFFRQKDGWVRVVRSSNVSMAAFFPSRLRTLRLDISIPYRSMDNVVPLGEISGTLPGVSLAIVRLRHESKFAQEIEPQSLPLLDPTSPLK